MDKAGDQRHEEEHLAEQEQAGIVAEERDLDIENVSDDSDEDYQNDELEDDLIRFNRLHSYQEEFDQEDLEVHASFVQEEHPDAHLNHNPDIVIIGAGPVGLWVAVQIKLLQPNKEILILEKYQVYQRSHLLRLVKSSLNTISDHPCLESFKQFAKTLIGKIRTNDLERSLWQKAESLGIKKEFMEVKDVLGLKKMFSNLKVIIGADGSHSLVRKQVFEDKLSVKQTIEHVAFVKYDVKGQGKGLKLTDGYAGMKLMHHLIYESVGKETNGQSPVTLQIKIDADTYKKMEGARFKTPYSLCGDKDKIDSKLMESVTVWLNMRTKFNSEERITQSTKVTTVNLDVYRAKTVAKEIESEEVAVFLCGDSACGVPFFRALNNGMICGSILAGLFKDHEGKMNKVVKKYNSMFDAVANKEIRKAKAVTWAHYMAEKAVRFNAMVPWQFISLRQIKKELLNPLPKEA